MITDAEADSLTKAIDYEVSRMSSDEMHGLLVTVIRDNVLSNGHWDIFNEYMEVYNKKVKPYE